MSPIDSKNKPPQQTGATESVTAAAWQAPSVGGEATPANDPHFQEKQLAQTNGVAPGVNPQAAALVQALGGLIPGFQGGLSPSNVPGAASSNDVPLEIKNDIDKTNNFLNTSFRAANIALGDLRSGQDAQHSFNGRADSGFIDNPAANEDLMKRLGLA